MIGQNILLKLRRFGPAPVLLYHHIADESKNQSLYHTVSKGALSQHLTLLTRYFTIISVDDLAAKLRRGEKLTGYASVTYDDARRSVVENALPIHNDLGIPGTIFVSGKTLSGKILWRDKLKIVFAEGLVERFCDFVKSFNVDPCPCDIGTLYKYSKERTGPVAAQWEELCDRFLAEQEIQPCLPRPLQYASRKSLQDLTNTPMDLGCHSYHHYPLRDLTRKEFRQDTRAAINGLKSITESPSVVYSVPFGGRNDITRWQRHFLFDRGFRAVGLSAGRWPLANHAVQPKGRPADIYRTMAYDGVRRFLYLH